MVQVPVPTSTHKLVEAATLPDTPLIVMLYAPSGVLLVVATVRVEFCAVALLNAVSAEKLHVGSLELVAPAGTVPNAQLSVTDPVKELPGVTAIVEVPLEPWATVRVVGEAVREKPVVVVVLGACQKSPQPVRKQARIGVAARKIRAQLPILITTPFAPFSRLAVFNNPLSGYRPDVHPVSPTAVRGATLALPAPWCHASKTQPGEDSLEPFAMPQADRFLIEAGVPMPAARNPAMFHTTEDLRIQWTKVVLPPVFLEEERPITEAASSTIFDARNEISAILSGQDTRLLVLVGPCSIHDPKAAREYAALLKAAIAEFSADLRIAMRVYFEKPRTTIGWKGLINDPYLDQSYKINDGLRLARHLLMDLAEMGVPTGTEFLDMISPQYLAGLVAWGAIGARTTESQVHRQLVSGISCPVGFKNGTSGNVQIAIDAILSAAHSHAFLGHTKHGQSAILMTTGNSDCHIILRGGRGTVNYTAESVADTAAQMEKAGLAPRIMIDFSHANSSKDYRRQAVVCHDVAAQIAAGDKRIMGAMIESNLVAGAQPLVPGQPLVYGQSITDPCIDWPETHTLLKELAQAVRTRRG